VRTVDSIVTWVILSVCFQPGPIPGMRPPMGGGSHQAPAKTSSMGLIMPLYTVGIVSFFIYTIMKVSQGLSGSLKFDFQKKIPFRLVKAHLQENHNNAAVHRSETGRNIQTRSVWRRSPLHQATRRWFHKIR